MIDVRSITVGLVLTAALVGTAGAQAGKKPKKETPQAGKEAAARPRATDVEIRIIREYYLSKGVKAKPLPPGIAKNLARGKPLPPGIITSMMITEY